MGTFQLYLGRRGLPQTRALALCAAVAIGPSFAQPVMDPSAELIRQQEREREQRSLALCTVLHGCCSTPSHDLYVKRSNAKIGKTFQELDPQFAPSKEQDIRRYEKYYDKIDYRGVKV